MQLRRPGDDFVEEAVSPEAVAHGGALAPDAPTLTAEDAFAALDQREAFGSERFAAAWQVELAEVPKFTEGTIHIVAGLLLPIWKRLPNESTRVYRLQTDAGERVIGRRVSPAWVAVDGRPHHSRPCGGPPAAARPCHGHEPHRAYRLHRQLRLFAPTDGSGPSVLAKVLERYPVERVSQREAA
jgi:hypothetical protein